MEPNSKLSRTSTYDLHDRITWIYDHLYANSSVRTPTGICDEVGKLLHVGMYIEEVLGTRPAFQISRTDLKRTVDSSDPLIPEIARAVRKRFREMNDAWKLYSPKTVVELADGDIAFVCGNLSGILISDKSRDIFGDALEIFRSVWAKRAGGQFFTDPHVTHLAMALLGFDPLNGERLLDPAAGTGGFLLAGVNRIRELLEMGDGPGSREDRLLTLARHSISGVEVDTDVCAAANATLKARLGHTSSPFVQQADSLREFINDEQNRLPALGTLDCVAANPPFGTRITIKDPTILRNYEVARVSPAVDELRLGLDRTTPKPPDVLFLELCVRLLKPGTGRLAIILPYQILSGPQMAPVRAWLLRHVQLRAVIDLPVETFQPHTGTRTALVVCQRRWKPLSQIDGEEKPVFMSIPKWIGHDRRGNPIYQRDKAGIDTGEILSDFAAVEQAYREFEAEGNPTIVHATSFVVPHAFITADAQIRMNALYHQPMAGRDRFASTAIHADWDTIRLGDVVERIFFPTRFKRAYVERNGTSVPFLGGSNITEWIHTADKWLRSDDRYLEQLRVRSGWILVTRSGTTGIVSSVPPAWDGLAMSEHVIRIVPKKSAMSGHYIEAVLRSALGQSMMARGVFGSVIPEITAEFLADLVIPVPKQRSTLKKIVDSMKRAQEARQQSIEAMHDALSLLEATVARQSGSKLG